MTDDQTNEPTEDRVPDANPEEQPEQPRGNKEAARYRHRLREAEAERDALAEQVTALRRAAVEDRVKAQKVPVEGFWASGVQLEALLGEDGQLDDEAIKAAADNAVETLGLERVGVRMRPVPSEGRVTRPSGTKSWEAAFGAQ